MRQLIFSLALLAPTVAPALEIPDRDLRSAISIALGIPALELTEAHLADLIDLDPGDRLITDLTGLEHAINLETAVLDDNQLTDLTPLSTLTKLRVLDLSDNRITDLSDLAGLVALEELILEDNDITDVSPLAGLPAIESLNLADNKLTDIAPLASLTTLTYLQLDRNQITDFSPVTNLPNLSTLIPNNQRQIPAPPVSIALDPAAPANITISWPGDIGLSYQLRFSQDFSTWQAVTSSIDGTGAPVVISVPLPAAKQGFFEVLATKQP